MSTHPATIGPTRHQPQAAVSKFPTRSRRRSESRPVPVTGERRPTSRPVRWGSYGVLMILLFLRLPQTHQSMTDQVAREAGDLGPGLLNLAVSSALVIGLVVFAIVLAVYLALADLLERSLCDGSLRFGRDDRQGVGLYTAVAVCSILVIQGWALAAGQMPSTLERVTPVLIVGLAALVVYRRHLAGLGRFRAITAAAVAIFLGAAVTLI